MDHESRSHNCMIHELLCYHIYFCKYKNINHSARCFSFCSKLRILLCKYQISVLKELFVFSFRTKSSIRCILYYVYLYKFDHEFDHPAISYATCLYSLNPWPGYIDCICSCETSGYIARTTVQTAHLLILYNVDRWSS